MVHLYAAVLTAVFHLGKYCSIEHLCEPWWVLNTSHRCFSTLTPLAMARVTSCHPLSVAWPLNFYALSIPTARISSSSIHFSGLSCVCTSHRITSLHSTSRAVLLATDYTTHSGWSNISILYLPGEFPKIMPQFPLINWTEQFNLSFGWGMLVLSIV